MIKEYDLNTAADVSELQSETIRIIEEDRSVATKYWTEWNDAVDRLNGDVEVPNFTKDALEILAAKNDPQQSKQELKQFVSPNRARPNHEATIGDFIAIRRRLSIWGRRPNQRNIGRVFQERVRYIEDDEMLPERVYFPCIDGSVGQGLWWAKIQYNPFANNLKGKFTINAVNCRDVLVDANSHGTFFDTAKRFTHIFQLTEDEALMTFQHVPFYDPAKFNTDNDYNMAYNRAEGDMYYNRMGTFYELQRIIPSQSFYFGNPKNNELEEFSYAQYQLNLMDPILSQFTFPGEITQHIYKTLYNTSQGVFSHQRSEISEFNLIPWGNIFSDGRLYPMGDVKIYAELLDLFDVLVTVYLENAKRQNVPIIPVNPEAMQEYAAELENAVRHGGIAPGATNVAYPQPINVALTQLLPWVMGWIQDSVSKHSASMGEMPAQQVAKETVQTLIGKDRQAHGRKDLMIRYALTKIARVLAAYINVMETEPDVFTAIDPKGPRNDFIPVNQVWGEQEYLARLSDYAGMPVPQDPAQTQIYLQALQQIRMEFERKNDVKTEMVDGFILIDPDTGGPVELTPEKLREFITRTGMNDVVFGEVFNPQPQQIKIFKVNVLTQDVDLKIVYGIDDDYENDPQFRANKALMLHSRQAYSRVSLLRDMGVQNPEEEVEAADAENQYIQMAKELAANPDMQQAIADFQQKKPAKAKE